MKQGPRTTTGDPLEQPFLAALNAEGRYRSLLTELDRRLRVSTSDIADPSLLLLRGELWQKLGHIARASDIAAHLSDLRLRSDQSVRLCLLQGELAQDLGHRTDAMNWYRQAVRHAKSSPKGELGRWALLRLLWLVGDDSQLQGTSGNHDQESLFIETASFRLVAAFNLMLAERFVKSGLVDEAEYRISVAESLLASAPNLWLLSLLRIHRGCLHYIRGEFAAAQQQAGLAIGAAQESGHHRSLCSAAINLGSAYLAMGHAHRASEAFLWVQQAAADGSRLQVLAQESSAEVLLATRDYDECGKLLQRAQQQIEALRVELSAWELDWSMATRVRQSHAVPTNRDSIALTVPRSHPESLVAQRLALLGATEDLEKGRSLEGMRSIASVMLSARRVGLPTFGQSLALRARAEELVNGDLARGLYRAALPILVAAGNAADVVDCVAHYWAFMLTTGSCEAPTPDRHWSCEGLKRPTVITTRLDSVTGLDDSASCGRDGLIRLVSLAWSRERRPELVAEFALRLLVASSAVTAITLNDCRENRARTIISWHAKDVEQASSGIEEIRIPDGAVPQFVVSACASSSPEAVELLHAVAFLLRAVVPRDPRPAELRSGPVAQERTPSGAVFASPSMRTMLSRARRAGVADANVLITGESGSGKEVIARYVHDCSPRSSRPFVPINCSAIPRDLFDSLLFGHRRGSFTGAAENAAGLIRSADGGTLFLDEIAELPYEAQPKLLRFLDTREVLSIGDSRPQTVDVRVVAATNADVEQLVDGGKFRRDLFYRLNIFRLNLAPIRERPEDLDLLIEHFLQEAKRRVHRPEVRLSDAARLHLRKFHWPGNVRQVSAEILSMVANCDDRGIIDIADLSPQLKPCPNCTTANGHSETVPGSGDLDRPLTAIVRDVERRALARALEDSGGNLTAAAMRLGLSRKGLYLMRQRLGVEE